MPATLPLQPPPSAEELRATFPAAQLEISTAPTAEAPAAPAQLATARSALLDACDGLARPTAAGVHPFSAPAGGLSSGDRYDGIEDAYGPIARRQRRDEMRRQAADAGQRDDVRHRPATGRDDHLDGVVDRLQARASPQRGGGGLGHERIQDDERRRRGAIHVADAARARRRRRARLQRPGLPRPAAGLRAQLPNPVRGPDPQRGRDPDDRGRRDLLRGGRQHDDRADLCALGRPHLYNPYWTLHAAADQGYRGDPWIVQYRSGRRKPQDGTVGPPKTPPRRFDDADGELAADAPPLWQPVRSA